MSYFTLALFAGYVLDSFWNSEATQALATLGLNIPRATLSGMAGLFLTLAPAITILVKNPKQENWLGGIISSVFSAAVALSLSISHLSRVFSFDFLSKKLALTIEPFAKYLILGGVVASILGIISFKLKKLDQKS